MYKLLIVDDEALARYSIRTMISRNFSEIEVVGEAENGRQAIELNEQLMPDIIIMDIKVPGINGIDASREILSRYPLTSILILTAYDNFDYVQKALDIGVRGYLLKPLQKDEFTIKINKIISNIENRADINKNKESIEKQIKTVRPVLEKEIVSSILKPVMDVKEIKDYISFLQFDFESGYFMIFSVLNELGSSIRDSIRNKIDKDKVYDYLSNNLPLMRQCLFGHTIGNMIVVFFPSAKNINPAKISQESYLIAKEMVRKIKIVKKISVACGIGRVYFSIEELKKSFEEARKAVEYSEKTGEAAHFENLDKLIPKEVFEYPMLSERHLIENIRAANIEKAVEAYNEISELVFVSKYDFENIKEYLLQLLSIVKRTMLEMGIDFAKISGFGKISETKYLSKEDDLKHWFGMVINSLCSVVKEFRESKENLTATKIYDFVNTNFTGNISLDTLAEEFALSTQYISKIFKDVYGKNFIDYLTEKRMGYAKELFRDKNISIKEVSKKTGYEDPNYFCRIFKKHTGLTPKEYKKRRI